MLTKVDRQPRIIYEIICTSKVVTPMPDLVYYLNTLYLVVQVGIECMC